MPYWFNVQIFGTDGVIRNDNQLYTRDFPYKDWQTIQGVVPDSGAVWHHPFEAMIAEFIECVRHQIDPACNLFDAGNTHRACFAAEESARRGGVTIRVA